MNDDDVMDQLLRRTLASQAPEVSPGFDADLLQRVQPRRLTRSGRAQLAIYCVVAVAATFWLMRDLPLLAIGAAAAIATPVAAVASIYGRRFARMG